MAWDYPQNDLVALPREDRIALFRRTTYVQPLHFLKEINGTTYAVRAFFDDEAKDNIVEKVQRIQIVDIHYSGIGILDELTPEEMEESFQKSFAERKKTKTA